MGAPPGRAKPRLGDVELLHAIRARGTNFKYVIGAFIALALLFDGLGLIATGYGGRRIVGLVSDRLAADVTERDESVEHGGKPVQPE